MLISFVYYFLGKTLIAAVVMYNFWRWYPTGGALTESQQLDSGLTPAD